MKVQVSKVMAREINKNIPEKSTVESVYYSELTPAAFDIYAGRALDNFRDYIPGKEKMKVLVVTYTPDCYAPARYITTNQLNRIFSRCNGSYYSFMIEFFSESEV